MRVRPVLRLILLPLLATTLVAACGATGAGSGTGGVTPSASAPASAVSKPPSVAGGPMVGNRAFVSTAVTGHQLVAGTKVTLTFRDATLSAISGCNSMSGEYQIVGGTLAVGAMSMTEMGCQQDLMAQDDWLAKLLPGATVQIAEASLTLTKGDVSIAFVDRQTTNLPLEGTLWMVDGLVSGDTVSSVPAGVSATLAIAGGKAHINTGCNSGSVAVTVATGTITFATMSMTAMGCSGAAGAVEKAVLAALQGVQLYRVDGDSLTVGASGKAGLTLRGTDIVVSSDPGPS